MDDAMQYQADVQFAPFRQESTKFAGSHSANLGRQLQRYEIRVFADDKLWRQWDDR